MKSGPDKELAERYFDRFSKSGPALGLEFSGVAEIAESRAQTAGERRREEAQRLQAQLGPGISLILLDERGKNPASEELAGKIGIGEPTLKLIIENLLKPGRDPREEMPKPILRQDVLKLDDLSQGMRLQGTVRNVVDFGAFVDIGVKVGKGDLGLHHPEFGQVAAGVRVFGAEGGPKGVDFGQGQAVGLDIELPGYGQEGLAAKEILTEINTAACRARQVKEIQGADPK
jgi:hypothetical protein